MTRLLAIRAWPRRKRTILTNFTVLSENRNRQSGWCLLKEALAWQTIHGWIVSEERSVCGSAYLDAAGGEVVCFMEVAAGPGWSASVAGLSSVKRLAARSTNVNDPRPTAAAELGSG